MCTTNRVPRGLPHHHLPRRLLTTHAGIVRDIMFAMGVLALVLTCCGCTETGSGRDQQAQPDAWAATVERGTLRVGTEGTYSPYSYHGNDGDLTGYDIELVQAIAEKLGLRAEFSEMGFDGLAAGLDSGKFDVVADQICVTPEREEKYLFSHPYAFVKGVVITRGDRDDVKSFEDLRDKDVSLTITSNWAKVAESHGARIVSTGGFSESMQMVADGRVDATVNDNLVFLDYMAQHPDAPVRIAATAEETDVVALMMRKGDGQLRDKVSGALEELDKDGTLASLSKKYFGEDISHRVDR